MVADAFYDYVYKMARGNGAAVILDTDDKDKRGELK